MIIIICSILRLTVMVLDDFMSVHSRPFHCGPQKHYRDLHLITPMDFGIWQIYSYLLSYLQATVSELIKMGKQREDRAIKPETGKNYIHNTQEKEIERRHSKRETEEWRKGLKNSAYMGRRKDDTWWLRTFYYHYIQWYYWAHASPSCSGT